VYIVAGYNPYKDFNVLEVFDNLDSAIKLQNRLGVMAKVYEKEVESDLKIYTYYIARMCRTEGSAVIELGNESVGVSIKNGENGIIDRRVGIIMHYIYYEYKSYISLDHAETELKKLIEEEIKKRRNRDD